MWFLGWRPSRWRVQKDSELFATVISSPRHRRIMQSCELFGEKARVVSFHVERNSRRVCPRRFIRSPLPSFLVLPLPLFLCLFLELFYSFSFRLVFPADSPSLKWKTARHRINDGTLIRLSTYFAYGEMIPVQNFTLSSNFLAPKLRYMHISQNMHIS